MALVGTKKHRFLAIEAERKTKKGRRTYIMHRAIKAKTLNNAQWSGLAFFNWFWLSTALCSKSDGVICKLWDKV